MHGFANPARFLRLARLLTAPLLMGGAVLSLAALAWGLLGAPAERLQGDSVRILFVHVPAAWLGMGSAGGTPCRWHACPDSLAGWCPLASAWRGQGGWRSRC